MNKKFIVVFRNVANIGKINYIIDVMQTALTKISFTRTYYRLTKIKRETSRERHVNRCLLACYGTEHCPLGSFTRAEARANVID